MLNNNYEAGHGERMFLFFATATLERVLVIEIMFSVYLWMPKKTPLEQIEDAFNEAECFMLASVYLNNENDRIVPEKLSIYVGISVVAEINHAFAIEMYLKCLLLITKSEKQKGHNLGKLFDQLSKDVKARLNKKYKQLYVQAIEDRFNTRKPHSLGEKLKRAHEYFLNARYYFEENYRMDRYKRYELYDITGSIKEIIFELQPELRANN